MDGLLGRDHELTAVEELLANGGAVLLVEGGMGVGSATAAPRLRERGAA